MPEEVGQVIEEEEELDPRKQAVRLAALAQIRQYRRRRAEDGGAPGGGVRRRPAPPRRADEAADGRRATGSASRRPRSACSAAVRLPGAEDETVALVNPRIVERAEETDVEDEGCLSIQGVLLPVERSATIVIEGEGRARAATCGTSSRSTTSRVAQHETDHLDGVLILDRTTPEARARGAREPAPAHRPRLSYGRGSRSPRPAPFGADVLERLAARHEVVQLFTPARTGRAGGAASAGAAGEGGRRAARDPGRAAGAARRLRAGRGARGRRLRLRPADPERAARARALAQRPSVAAAALARAPRRSSGRSWPGTRETGVTIHRTTAALDAGPIAAQRASRSRRRTTRRRLRARGRGRRASFSTTCSPTPRLHAAARGGRDLRREDRARGPRARLVDARRRRS